MREEREEVCKNDKHEDTAICELHDINSLLARGRRLATQPEVNERGIPDAKLVCAKSTFSPARALRGMHLPSGGLASGPAPLCAWPPRPNPAPVLSMRITTCLHLSPQGMALPARVP